MTAQHPIIEGVRFKDIAGFPGYCVGDDGSVWSRHRVGPPYGLTESWHRLHPSPLSKGHLTVSLRANGRRTTRLVHRLVLEAFVGPCPEGMEGCHGPDPNPANCRLANLRWDTSQANVDECIAQDRHSRGARNGSAKLNDFVVAEIRRRRAVGERQKDLAAEFGVSQSVVSEIIKGKLWKHTA